MNSLTTEEPSSRNWIEFLRDEGFEKQVANLAKKYRLVEDGMKSLCLLLERQFHPISPQVVISPKVLHHVSKMGEYSLWKVTCAIPKSGLSSGQMPRIYFAHHGNKILFLAMGNHTENYDDHALRSLAIQRANDYFS